MSQDGESQQQKHLNILSSHHCTGTVIFPHNQNVVYPHKALLIVKLNDCNQVIFDLFIFFVFFVVVEMFFSESHHACRIECVQFV